MMVKKFLTSATFPADFGVCQTLTCQYEQIDSLPPWVRLTTGQKVQFSSKHALNRTWNSAQLAM